MVTIFMCVVVHTLNLIVQHGLKTIDSSVVKIRESVKFIKGSEMRGMKFAECVKYVSLEAKKKLRQDVPTRWNFTYLMLDSALPYRAAFHRLQRVDGQYEHCPSEYEWIKIGKVAEFLKPFYEMTLPFSGSYYPIANLYFLKVLKIELLIRKNIQSSDEFIHSMAAFMNEKFKKYWECYTVILSLAFILDPRYKLRYLQFCFEKLDPLTTEEKVRNLKKKLEALFEIYLRAQPLASSLSQGGTAMVENEDDIRDELGLEFDSYNSQHEASISKSQLAVYLEEKLLPRDKNFDILEFWKGNMLRYPELSLLARDILSNPITTVASESAFSHGGRILGKFQNSLLPNNVEALPCVRDWIFGGGAYDVLEHEEEVEMTFDVQGWVAQLGGKE